MALQIRLIPNYVIPKTSLSYFQGCVYFMHFLIIPCEISLDAVHNS
jgi:hypothetical protein